jgi:hypothetical protein
MKMNVILVMLLKVKGQRYNENIVTWRVFIVCAYCLHTIHCVENVQIKENVFVKMKCEVSCLNWIWVNFRPCLVTWYTQRISLMAKTPISDPRVKNMWVKNYHIRLSEPELQPSSDWSTNPKRNTRLKKRKQPMRWMSSCI